MRSALDQPYTSDIIESIMKSWPAIESCRFSGRMSMNVSEKEHVSFERAQANFAFQNMIPRSNSKNNSIYQIDDLASIVCDIHKAMETLTEVQLSRLMRYHNEGYTLEEIGNMDGCTKVAVEHTLTKCYDKMATYLESPKVPVKVPAYAYESYTHRRSFSSPNHNHPVR